MSARNLGRTVFLALAFLVIVVAALWTYRWLTAAADVTSAKNVKAQWTSLYQHLEALDTTARQICSTERALAAAGDTPEASQRRTHVLTYEQNYARIQGEYNAKVRNAFEAKLVKPNDVPEQAPTLNVTKIRVCPTK